MDMRLGRLMQVLGKTMLGLALVLSLGLPMRALAQSGGKLVVTAPETGKFPALTVPLEAFDAQGNFVSTLKANDLQILENSQPLPVAQLELVEPGVQVIVAVNASPLLGATGGGTVTRLDQLKQSLIDFAGGWKDNGLDELSLQTNTGVQTLRMVHSVDWVTALQDYKPELARAQGSLLSLSRALDQATDPTPRPKMKRAILYITPPPEDANAAVFPNLADRAIQANARIYVWMVTTPAAPENEATKALRQLVTRTGGQFFTYTGTEVIPNPADYLAQLRGFYRVTYTSRITQGGDQRLAVKWGDTVSAEQAFKLDVQPPNPIFMAPPSTITRNLGAANSQGAALLTPESISLKVLIEFPDGHNRALDVSRLYVNGELAAENTSAPFDRFLWSLAGIKSSGRYQLRVEAVDALGLSRSSIETPVEVLVETPAVPAGVAWLTANMGLVGGAAAGLIGVIVLAVLAVRLVKPRLPVRRKNAADNRPSQPRRAETPAPQPAPVRQSRALSGLNAPARLVRLNDTGHVVAGGSIPLQRHELTLGSDPKQSICVLDNPTVDGLHARLERTADDRFIITDAGSTAGTWVNFTPVPEQGVVLEHGDWVQIGAEAFRFELSRPKNLRMPQAMPYKEQL